MSEMTEKQLKEYIEEIVLTICSPEQIHSTLANLEGQLLEAEGKKRLVIEAFILGIKRSLGKVS